MLPQNGLGIAAVTAPNTAMLLHNSVCWRRMLLSVKQDYCKGMLGHAVLRTIGFYRIQVLGQFRLIRQIVN
jgi:hypothetical protein